VREESVESDVRRGRGQFLLSGSIGGVSIGVFHVLRRREGKKGDGPGRYWYGNGEAALATAQLLAMETRRREVSVWVSEAEAEVKVGSTRGDGELLSAMFSSSVVVGLPAVLVKLREFMVRLYIMLMCCRLKREEQQWFIHR
jgi:hypothetical protein